jgi:long-chain fatty acid transport protein
MKMIPALMLVAFSGAASASGFQLQEQNASGLGNAYAGSAAVAEDASTIYFNPAGMTQLQAREVSGGLSLIVPSFKFKDKGSSLTGNLANEGDGGDAGGLAALPNGYISWALNKDLYVGVGIGAPFGLKTEYDDRWIGAAQASTFEIKTFNINPSIAYRVNDAVSVGLGVNWQKIEAEYIRLATVGGAPSPGLAFGDRVTSTMNLEDTAWGWNIGGLFTLSPTTKIGLSYRSKMKYDTDGKVKLTSDGTAFGDATLAALVAAGRQSDLSASLTLPDTFIMSVTQNLSDKWEMLGDVSWTGWSSIPKVDIMRTSGILTGDNAQTLETDFRDTWRVALGANYKYNDAWKLKFGVAYDQTPVKDPSTRLASLPDNDRIWLSLGTQWTPNKASRLDLGMTYIFIRDSKIDNDQTAAARGRITGEYEGNIWILGAQYSMAF